MQTIKKLKSLTIKTKIILNFSTSVHKYRPSGAKVPWTYFEHICIPVTAWHAMHSKCESRLCISHRLALRWRWCYVEQHWLAAAKQLVVNLQRTNNMWFKISLPLQLQKFLTYPVITSKPAKKTKC